MASKILMVKPFAFQFNPETSTSNEFQHSSESSHAASLTQQALAEFDLFVGLLRAHHLDVLVFEDHALPDAVFPNNWFSTHRGGPLVLYPMHAPNRRLERRPHIVDFLQRAFRYPSRLDLTRAESPSPSSSPSSSPSPLALEGTGSVVFDHAARVAYACRSPRTSPLLLARLCERLGYQPCLFDAQTSSGSPVYHTNVMLSVGSSFAVVCLDAVPDPSAREDLRARLAAPGRAVVAISLPQMHQFAANILECASAQGQRLIVMSRSAHGAFSVEQLAALHAAGHLVVAPLDTIERLGGGSARCMMAEIFLPEDPLPLDQGAHASWQLSEDLGQWIQDQTITTTTITTTTPIDDNFPSSSCTSTLTRSSSLRSSIPLSSSPFRYRIVDVFTTSPLEGNPLAVFPSADGLSPAQMQRIANEFNLSETVFVLHAADPSALSLRIFTPQKEMQFAGHPTIGAAWVLIDEGQVQQPCFTLLCRGGPVPIQHDAGSSMIWLQTPPITTLQTLDAPQCAAALGLSEGDLLSPEIPPQIVSAGNPTLLLALRDPETVDRAALHSERFKALTAALPHPVCFFFFAPVASGAYSRMLAPQLGIAEDPATGSSTGPLAAYMLAHGLVAVKGGETVRLVSEQGTKMGRRSILHIQIEQRGGEAPAIKIGGNVVPIMSGYLTCLN